MKSAMAKTMTAMARQTRGASPMTGLVRWTVSASGMAVIVSLRIGPNVGSEMLPLAMRQIPAGQGSIAVGMMLVAGVAVSTSSRTKRVSVSAPTEDE